MTMEKTGTDRRSFLKTGALLAAPVVAAAPAAAFAADDRLVRLEDERAIEALQRKFLRHLNGAADCGEFIASSDAVDLGEGLRSIAGDDEPHVEVAEDGQTATARCPCRVERETGFTGDSTLEQMARFQGQGSHRFKERLELATEFVKGRDGWQISAARLA
jgi:hypothetical protein